MLVFTIPNPITRSYEFLVVSATHTSTHPTNWDPGLLRAFSLVIHSNHRGYRCLDLATNKIIISCNGSFDETVFPYGSVTPNATPSYTFLDDEQDNPPINAPSIATPIGLDKPSSPLPIL